MIKLIGRFLKSQFKYASGWHFFSKAKRSYINNSTKLAPDILNIMMDKGQFTAQSNGVTRVVMGLGFLMTTGLLTGGIYSIGFGNTLSEVLGGVVWIFLASIFGLFTYVMGRVLSKGGLNRREAQLIIKFVRTGTRFLPDPTNGKENAGLIERAAQHKGNKLHRIARR